MLLSTLVSTSLTVAATRSRLAKRDALAVLLRATERAQPDEIQIVVSYLAGELRQRRTGIGWASLRGQPEPADLPTLSLIDVDTQLQSISELSGAGSASARTAAVSELFTRATADEQRFLRALISGEIRQGALDSTMLDALALATGAPLVEIRRAVMLAGTTGPVAVAVLAEGAAGLAQFSLTVGRPVRPMLAASAPDVPAAMAKIGAGVPVCLDSKLDGIRIQAHKSGASVRLFTRSLDEITPRLPEVVAIVSALPAQSLILDGEVLALGSDGRPRPFQETASRTATDVGEGTPGAALSVYFFDILAIDGESLLELALSDRLSRLASVVPADVHTRQLLTGDPVAATEFFGEVLDAGQEGLVVKDLRAPYAAGRRGSGWIKVKPRHTLDLVVLAVEEGSGRRQGTLSNIHLGARDPEHPGEYVMLGKTFKGMTDEMLAWQTEHFQTIATGRDGHVVWLRPEQVVEVAFDGVQRSSRYPGGVALRFARVLRYRDDKTPAEADTLSTVQQLASWFGEADENGDPAPA